MERSLLLMTGMRALDCRPAISRWSFLASLAVALSLSAACTTDSGSGVDGGSSRERREGLTDDEVIALCGLAGVDRSVRSLTSNPPDCPRCPFYTPVGDQAYLQSCPREGLGCETHGEKVGASCICLSVTGDGGVQLKWVCGL
jgi:hypothetical protein